MILHLIQSSPEQSSALKTCLRYATQSDSILLTGNSVNCLLKQAWATQLKEYNVAALQEDVIARGLTSLLKDTKQINYDEFVSLSLKFNKVISW
ncbi:sulfurtransferase complex subunit TusB [Shewanella marinintestina]|uniref:sulfurtransferase complex subunit TusB n=1 Tax=Shewanella marinintestina TaxID=190305 RepID=UPI00200D64D2|nr:sulfurtransferase complex subunit TusB [Shewanella marinintestina]MCL1144443.1 sulfurtransferase complex subunit TusB [Shewanella marinintestina]